MMDARTIERMTRRKRVRLSPASRFIHYLPVLPFIWASLVLIAIMSQFDKSGSYGSFQYTEGIMPFAPPFIIISFLLYRYQRAKLGMTEIRIKLEKGEFTAVLDYMKKHYRWDIDYQSEGLIRAHKYGPKTLGFEEIITLIRSSDTMLINSRSNTAKWASLTSIGRNMRNIAHFLRALDKCCQQSPEISQSGWDDGTSPLTAIMLRIGAGIICLGSTGLAIWLIVADTGWISWLVGWGIISFVVFVIDTDAGEALKRKRAYKRYGKKRFGE